MVAGITDALAQRAGVRIEKPHARANEFAMLPALEVGRAFLHGLGVSTAGMNSTRLAQLLCDRQAVWGQIGERAATNSTSDFPGLLGNVLNKALIPGYDEEPSTWEMWADPQLVNDFKDAKAVQMGRIAAPPKVLEGAEYEFATFGERSEVYRIAKYGVLLPLTWEMLINDDLGAFTQEAMGFGPAAKALENDLLYAELLSNPTMAEDSTALFHADHGNLYASGDADPPSQTTLDAMRLGMQLQRGIKPKTGQQGRVLNLRLNTLLVPGSLVTTAEILTSSATQFGQANPNVMNPKFIRNLTVISDSRLDANSSTAWYGLAAKVPGLRTAVVLKLRGNETPYIAQIQDGSTVDGVVYKLRHCTGAKILDYRGVAKNNG